ncbi:Crp/Fnr family transcriptional regulator [Flavobacteriaceae bacterium AU392]|nr:Crp/Fnr family transcriptional regulator [Flavobacteriaceae bacterium]RKM81323.1 Crp/Fnr family transcriptional regulator [Flavobacteriaceae bacterium AU392]
MNKHHIYIKPEILALKLKTIFDPYFVRGLENWKKFAALGDVVYYPKGTILKKPYQVEKYYSIILEGSGSIQLWNENNYKCLDLTYDLEKFGDYTSFITRQSTPLETILLEDSKLFQIPYYNFQKMLSESPVGEKITRIMTEVFLIEKQQQQINLLTKTASERFLELKEQVPNLLNRTPKKSIASYLGITPQSLSRITKTLI